MILDRDADLDRLVAEGKLSAHDAEQVEMMREFLTYGPPTPRPGGSEATRPQLRWMAAFLRTERGATFLLGGRGSEALELAARYERAAARHA